MSCYMMFNLIPSTLNVIQYAICNKLISMDASNAVENIVGFVKGCIKNCNLFHVILWCNSTL